MKAFEGLGVAMVTPFNADGSVDHPALTKLTRHLVDGGTDFLVVQGTTGETPVLSADEKKATLNTIMEANAGQLPLVLGVAGNNTAAVCKDLGEVPEGVDGILSASPGYNKPSQIGIVAHYQALSQSTDLPIILYNVPGRTASNVRAETTLAVVDACSNVVAVKEASGDLGQIEKIIAHAPEHFRVLSGDDGLTLPMLALGAHGLISVSGNAYPKQVGELVHAALEGDMASARMRHYQLMALTEALFEEGNPSGVKQLLSTLGICGPQVRLPLVPASPGLSERLAEMAKEQESFA